MTQCTISRGSRALWQLGTPSATCEYSKSSIRWQSVQTTSGNKPTHDRHASTTKRDAKDALRKDLPASQPINEGYANHLTPIDLPLSPLMDKSFLEAKKKHQHKKQPPFLPKSSLQLEIQKNPYARALASSVRRCGLSKVVLPRFFLQDFQLLAHPETDVPHFVPTSLASRVDASTAEHPSSMGGSNVYTSGTKTKLAEIVGKEAKRKLVRGTLNSSNQYREMLQTSIWRPDMDEFVLEMMRRRCVESLSRLSNITGKYLVGCRDWEDATAKTQVAAYFWLVGTSEGEADQGPKDFSTLDLGPEGEFEGGAKKRKRKIPVYNLQVLLGPEKLAELRKKSQAVMFDHGIVAMKHKNMTIGSQMDFWKLQGYVAGHGQESS